MFIKRNASRCIKNPFTIESLTSESESNCEVPRDSDPWLNASHIEASNPNISSRQLMPWQTYVDHGSP